MNGEDRLQKEISKGIVRCYESAIQRMEGKGIYLFASPTGIGKSHSAVTFIVDQWKKGERIWVTTANNNNVASLIEDVLKRAKTLLSEEDFDLFERQLLHLKKNESNFRENLGAIDKKDVAFLGSDAVRIIGRMKENSRTKEEFFPGSDIEESMVAGNSASRLSIHKQIEDDFNDLERKFRTILKKHIKKYIREAKKQTDNTEESMAKKDIFWKFLDEHPWVKRVYPYSQVERKSPQGTFPPVFCSVAKTAYACDPLIKPSQYLYQQIASYGGIVIIDEIDQSKEHYKNAILNQNKPTNIFRIVYAIYENFTLDKFADIIEKGGKDESAKQRMKTFIKEIHEQAVELDENYFISQLRREFSDACIEELLKGMSALLTAAHTSIVQINIYISKTPSGALLIDIEPREGSKELREIYAKVKPFLKRVIMGSGMILEALARKNGRESMVEEANLSSFLNLIGIESGAEQDYMMMMLKQRANERPTPINSLYTDGFFLSVPQYINEDTERNTTLTVGVETTPEAILAKMAKNCFVMGLSATADCKTVIDNYNYDWIRDQEISVQTPNEEEWRYIKERQAERFKTLENTKISASVVPDLVGDLLKEGACGGLQINDIIIRITERAAEKYKADGERTYNGLYDRYYEQIKDIINAVLEFIVDERHKAGLIFSQKHFGPYMNKDMKKLLALTGIDNVEVLFANTETLKAQTEKAHELLDGGTRVVIVCPFATAGQAWNFNYIANEEDVELVEISDEGGNKVDFDYMYLGDITNILPGVTEKEKKNKSNLLPHLYTVLDLYEAGELSINERNSIIKYSYLAGRSVKMTDQIVLQSFQYSIIRTVVQSIGRMERSRMKRPLNVIRFSSSLCKKVDRGCVEEFLDEHVLNPITENALRALAEQAQDLQTRRSVDEQRLSKKAQYIGKEINLAFGKKRFNDRSMSLKNRMKYFTLRHPKACSDDFKEEEAISSQYYLNESREIFYEMKNDWNDIDIRFESFPGYTRLDEDASLLPAIMRNDEVRAAFASAGYATEWGGGSYQMAPTLMNNIYKGGIGEEAVRVLLQNRGLMAVDITDVERFELCDYMCRGIPMDVKNYNPDIYTADGIIAGDTKETFIAKVKFKCGMLERDKMVFVNTLSNGKHRIYTANYDGIKIYSIPGLIDIRTGEIVEENMNALLSILGGLYDRH